MILAGEAAGAQRSQGAELGFEAVDFLFNGLNSRRGFHI
jgi:hypothetical protein